MPQQALALLLRRQEPHQLRQHAAREIRAERGHQEVVELLRLRRSLLRSTRAVGLALLPEGTDAIRPDTLNARDDVLLDLLCLRASRRARNLINGHRWSGRWHSDGSGRRRSGGRKCAESSRRSRVNNLCGRLGLLFCELDRLGERNKPTQQRERISGAGWFNNGRTHQSLKCCVLSACPGNIDTSICSF